MLGAKLKELRRESGLSQDEVAIRLHTTRSTISRYERDISIPTALELSKLATVYDVSVEDLLNFDKESKSETIEKEDENSVVKQLADINYILKEREIRTKKYLEEFAYLLWD